MLNERIDVIIKRYENIAGECIDFARSFLVLPEEFTVIFVDCPSQVFPTIYNAAESCIDASGKGEISINAVWFAKVIEEHQDDVRFFVFHELRHIHQRMQINAYINGRDICETEETIQRWKDGFENYIRNDGSPDLTKNNVRQEVEIDANAYGIVLINIFQKENNIKKEIRLSLPEDADKLAWPRAKEYFLQKPEFESFRRKTATVALGKPESTSSHEPIIKGKKIGRNDPCPCGSGKKYKKCCGK